MGNSEINARVGVVMAVYNRREKTLACLRSLAAQELTGEAKLDVFVLDDASTDGTAAAIEREFPETVVLAGNGSLYWNGGMRRAYGAALERDYDYYLWMNDDTELDDHALRTLLETSHSLEQSGEAPAIVVGTTRHPQTGELTYGGRWRPTRLRPLHFELVQPGEEPRESETYNGNIALVPRGVAQRLGNIDPAYVQKMGDFDYGLRARQADCSVWVAPGTLGACATDPPRRTDQQPLVDELRRIWSPKLLPPRAWAVFCRRWAGALWPVVWLNPYVRRGLLLVLERLRRHRPA